MKNFELNEYGVKEMNEVEMLSVDGGRWHWKSIVGGIAGAAIGFATTGPVGLVAGAAVGAAWGETYE